MNKNNTSLHSEIKSDSFPYWSEPAETLLHTLNSSPGGLVSGEAAGRLEEAGPNSLETHKRSTPLGLFLNQFKSPIVLILLAATIISAFVHDWTDALIILAIVVGSAVLSFSQEYSASNAAEKLRQQVSLKAQVLRDGKENAIPVEQIVP